MIPKERTPSLKSGLSLLPKGHWISWKKPEQSQAALKGRSRSQAKLQLMFPTSVRLFTDCRVLKEHRYLLQSRQDGSAESRHYDHDDRLPEKRDVAEIYDDYLGKIIDDKIGQVENKVIDINLYREKEATEIA